MKKQSLSLILFFSCLHMAFAQRIAALTTNVGNDYLVRSIPSKSGGFFALGKSTGFSGNVDLMVLKLDSNGRILWAVNYGSEFDDIGTDLIEDSFGKIYVSGYTGTSGSNPGDAFLLKLDSAGSSLFIRKYGEENITETAKGLFLHGDGNVILFGTSQTTTSRGLVMSIDTATGNLEWSKILEGPSGETLSINSGFSSGTQSIWLAGDAGGNAKDAWSAIFNSNGGLTEIKAFSIPHSQYVSRIHPKTGGGFYMLGTTNLSADTSLKTDGFLLSVNQANNFQWARSFGSANADTLLDFQILGADSFLVCGKTRVTTGKVAGFFGFAGRNGQSGGQNAMDLIGSSFFTGSRFFPERNRVISIGTFDIDSAGFTTGLVSNAHLDSANCNLVSFTLPQSAVLTSTPIGNFNVLDGFSAQGVFEPSGNAIDVTDTSVCVIFTGLAGRKVEVSEFLIYPNPAHDKLTLEANGVDKLEWVDLLGKVSSADFSRTTKGFEIHTYSLLPGAYLLRLYKKEKVLVHKVFVSH